MSTNVKTKKRVKSMGTNARTNKLKTNLKLTLNQMRTNAITKNHFAPNSHFTDTPLSSLTTQTNARI